HTLPSTPRSSSSFSLNDTSPSAIYTLSLHDALPIFSLQVPKEGCAECARADRFACLQRPNSFQHVPCRSVSLQVPAHSRPHALRSEEHTSELQSRGHLVCRLLLEKKKNKQTKHHPI